MSAGKKQKLIKKGKVIDYGRIVETLDTVKIEHRDNDCFMDITNLIEG